MPEESTTANCWFLWIKHNARLRGWQRINTKLKHNNRNHRGSMGLETPRVDSPSWGVCYKQDTNVTEALLNPILAMRCYAA